MGLNTRFEKAGVRLKDSSGGTVSTAEPDPIIEVIGGAYSQTEIANNFATLTSQINKLTAAMNAGEG